LVEPEKGERIWNGLASVTAAGNERPASPVPRGANEDGANVLAERGLIFLGIEAKGRG